MKIITPITSPELESVCGVSDLGDFFFFFFIFSPGQTLLLYNSRRKRKKKYIQLEKTKRKKNHNPDAKERCKQSQRRGNIKDHKTHKHLKASNLQRSFEINPETESPFFF